MSILRSLPGRPTILSLWMLACLLCPVDAGAQMTYQPRDANIPDPEGFFTAPSTTVCRDPNGTLTSDKSVPDGGFVKQYTTVRIDTAATVQGACDWYNGGVFYKTEMRNVSSVSVRQYPPTLLPWHQPVYTNGYSQSLDTRVPGTTSGPTSGSHSEIGSYLYTWKTFAMSTNCMITPTASALVEKRINVVACLPDWKEPDASGNVPKFPTGEITIAYPASLAGPVEAAITAWSSRLAGTGVVFRGVLNGSCPTLGGNCVAVSTIGQCPDLPTACGCSLRGSSTSGTYTHVGNIWVPAVSRTESVTDLFREWVIAHELGHLLGLKHKEDTSCPTSTVMNTVPSTVCGTIPSGQPTSPTSSDGSAITNGVYGNASRKTCGW